MTVEEKNPIRPGCKRVQIDTYDGYAVRQYFNENVRRWYVYLPVNSGAREFFKKKEGRMLRSHYVYCRANLVAGVPKSHVIHHIDGDRENDNADNLQMLSHEEHNTLHDGEPSKVYTGRKHTAKTRELLREIGRRNGYNGQWDGPKKEHFPETIERMRASSAGRKNSQYRHDLPTEGVVRAYEKLKDFAAVANIFGCSIQAVRNRIEHREAVNTDWKKISDEDLMRMLDEKGGNQRQLGLEIQAPATSLFRRINKIKGISNARA